MKTTPLITCGMLLIAFFLFCSCGSDKKASSDSGNRGTGTTSDPAAQIGDAISKAMEGIPGGKGGETIAHQKLKDLLDENLRGGFSRTDYSSQSVGAFGFNISSAEATYETSGGKSVKVTITDTGGAGAAMMGMAAWSSMSLDKEDKNGWERTGTFEGHSSFEKYNKVRNESELALIVEKRFLVTLNGRDCDMSELKKLAGDLKINHLKKLI